MFPSREAVPVRLDTPTFRLEPLAPHHNEADHRAWSTSIDHIRATPGFSPELWGDDAWPYEMTAAENLDDLTDHAREFEAGEAYAFTVLDATRPDEVIGCVYINPDAKGDADSTIRFWVRAERAGLDGELETVIRSWLADDWPEMTYRVPGRDPV